MAASGQTGVASLYFPGMHTRPLWISALGFGLVYLAFLAFGLGFLWGMITGGVICHVVYRVQYGYWWSWD